MNKRHLTGFTMLELATVLAIVAIVVGVGMNATLGMLDSAKRATTEKRLDVIEKALMDYRILNERLPCPAQEYLERTDGGYGAESGSNGTCTVGLTYGSGTFPAQYGAAGVVPVRTLGIPDEYMFDGWGRKFTYAVYSALTYTDAFKWIYPAKHSTCNRPVVYGSTSPFTGTAAKPAYVLVSHGANGHGGYLSGSNRRDYGSQNYDEWTNCHCDDGTNDIGYDNAFVAHAYTQSSTDPADVFDDIVRYKEQQQMQSYYSQYAMDIWPVHVYSAISTNISHYNRTCHILWLSGTAYAVKNDAGTANTVYALAFTGDAQHVVVNGSLGCRFLKVTYKKNTGAAFNLGFSDLLSSAIPSCPAFDSNNKIATSDNGYVIMASTTTPYAQIWLQSGDTLNAWSMATALPSPPPARPTVLAFGRSADFLFLSDGSSYSRMYRRASGGGFPQLVTQPSGMINTPVSAAFSPDGRYFAMGDNSAHTIKLWRISGTAFTALSAVAAPSTLAGIAFSPDSQYLAGAGGIANGTYSSTINLYKIEDSDTFNAVSLTGSYTFSSAGIVNVAFARDNTLLVASPTITYEFRNAGPGAYSWSYWSLAGLAWATNAFNR